MGPFFNGGTLLKTVNFNSCIKSALTIQTSHIHSASAHLDSQSGILYDVFMMQHRHVNKCAICVALVKLPTMGTPAGRDLKWDTIGEHHSSLLSTDPFLSPTEKVFNNILSESNNIMFPRHNNHT